MLTATRVEPLDFTPLEAARTPLARATARLHLAILLAILIFGLAVRLYGFRGFGAVDDAAYAQIAQQMAQGTFEPGTYDGPAVFPLRVGIIYPTALLFRHFGVSEWTMVLFPFVLSVLGILVAYAAAAHFFGRHAGLIGAGLWALLPLDAFHAGILVPDLPAAFFASVGVLAVLLLVDSRYARRTLLAVGGLGAGVAFGISWLCKESVVYLVPFCGFLLVATLLRDWKRNVYIWVGVAAGSLAVLGGEMAVYYRTTGDWLFHLHETERNYRQYPNAFFVSGSSLTTPDQGSYGRAVLRRLFVGGPSTILLSAQFLYLPLLAAIVTMHALYWRNRSFLVPALWFASLAFMFNFASSSLSEYVPLVLFERYLYPVMLPSAVLVSGFLAGLFFDSARPTDGQARRERVFWGGLLAGFLLLVGAYKNYANRKWYPGWVSEVRVLSDVLRPTDRIYTDILSIHGLEFFWGYPATMNAVDFEEMSESMAMVNGDYVLLNADYLQWLVSKGGWWPTRSEHYRPPDFATDVPRSWDRVWHDGKVALYRVR